ncbi:MAG: glycosyltransferase [Alphaproteobacteria bacterium]|nr:glycosyltransferase [Alphaproteobacteria bacterium]
MAFPVYIGWDSREDIAFRVARHSLIRRSTVELSVEALRQPDLRARGLYARAPDPLQSTEFTYTRFLVPALREYRGWALFFDCDFLWLADVADLLKRIDDRYAAMCVHHDHRPPEQWKMDGKKQTVYPRKNWSSLVLWNCGHPANRALTPELVNRESGAFLHRFQWLEDEQIGALPETWNWLEGWSKPPAEGTPKVVHMTRGGPWFENWTHVDYAHLWEEERLDYEAVGDTGA